MEKLQARTRWPRVVGMVALHVGSTAFAERVVVKASNGEELYKRILREAWQKRKVKRWQSQLRKK